MVIIAISRELAALGDETAHELAETLGCRFVDRYALEERMKSFGVAGRKLRKYDERKPSFLAAFSQDREDYLHYLKTALFGEAGQGGGVFTGRGAGMVFRNVPGVFSVFLAAPLDIRIQRVKSYFHCDDKRARQIISRSDADREGFFRYFFDVRWRDAGNYHLVLNTGRLPPAVCADIIAYTRAKTNTPAIEEEGVRRVRELILGHEVKHRVLYEKQIPVHFLETSVKDGRVTLYGVAGAQSQVEAAVAAAREAAPAAEIVPEIQVVQEYHVMP